VSDLLAPEVAKWQYVEEKVRSVLDAFGYREARTSVVAPDGALRPPGAAALARSYVAHAGWQREPATRWYELGPVFRRIQDRVQQNPQLAGAVFGAGGPAVDAEAVAMLVGLVAEAGVPPAATAAVLAAEPDRPHQERVRGLLAALRVRADVRPLPADVGFQISAEDVPLVQGGRADRLVQSLGGPPLPAFTFTVDLAALVEAVPDPAESYLVPPAALLVADGDRATDWTLATAHRLRLGGLRIEMGMRAVQRHGRLVVIARDADLARGKVVVEDLAIGGREEIAVEELEALIRLRLD
jgi:histidyl-tRNA synthetase